MPITRRNVLGAAAGLSIAATARAQTTPPPPIQWPPAEHFPLWPGKAPGSPATLPVPPNERNGYKGEELWLRGVDRPIVGVYRPAKPDGRAVLVIPGGGYGFVSVSNEGIDVAATLTPHGITVFVLAYRLPGDGWSDRAQVPLQDAQRAMRLIRANAAKWRIDPTKLGVLGFSAGGHLAADLSVAHDERVYAPIDAADTQPARPAYAGLVYAVVSFASAGLNSRSAAMLLGDNPDPALTARRTPLDRVTAAMPPVFLLHAMDDGTVPIQQSLAMIDACRRAKVPVEAHLLESGGHGFGAMHLPADAPGRLWPEIFARWNAKH